MDDSELPTSPRKKAKLAAPCYGTELADTATEVQRIPELGPHHHTATTNDQLRKPATMGFAEHSISPQASNTNAQFATFLPSAPYVDSEDLRDRSEASAVQLDKNATNAPEVESKHPGVMDTLDDPDNKEVACGITEFVSPDLLGFSGILKKRYTDFLVNEILPSGEVVHLENLKAPRKPHNNTGLPRSAGRPSSAKDTEQEAEVSLETSEQVCKEKEQQRTTTRAAINNDPQALPHTDASNQQQTTSEPKETLSDIQARQAIPQSMQDYNIHELAHAPVDNQENISPHKRIPPPGPSIPLSMQCLDGEKQEPKQENVTRRKQKVHIRQTSQGWVEFDKEKEDEMKKLKAQEDLAAGGETEDASPMKDIKLEEVNDGSEPQELDQEQVPKASTQASWQAFAGSAPSVSLQLQPNDKNTLLSYFSPFFVDEILALYDRIIDSPHRKARDYGVIKSEVIDRQKRTTIHQDIRRIFHSRLETRTDNDGALIITAMSETPTFYARTPVNTDTRGSERGSQRGNDGGNKIVSGRGNDSRSKAQGSGHGKGKPRWEELGGEYLHFTLYKENKDTMEAISWLAKQLKMNARSFQFAGTKDRRAVTVQRVSVERVLVNAVISAGRTLRNAYIGNFQYRAHPLQLGELTGNEFVITLRDCDFHYPVPLESKLILEGARIIVGEAIENLSEKGFINYYGLQRFGTFSIGTEVVGLKMLQGDFQGAVDAILDYNPASLAAAQNAVYGNTDKISMDDRARAYALHSYKTNHQPGRALQEMPRRYSAETCIIRHLTGKSARHDDYLGALQTISRNLRLMYVHAYQSLVWNVATSERWKRFGSSVIEGDLVLINDHTDKVEGVNQAEDVDADGEAIVRPGTYDRAANPDDIFERARALTKEEAESGRYSIFDIVLPTPGYDMIYPSNPIGKFYEDFMASERGGGLNPHDMRRQWKDISLSGSYRKILARPGKGSSFEIKAYKDEDEQFVVTDADRLGIGTRSQQNGHSRREQGNHINQANAAGSFGDGSKPESERWPRDDSSKMEQDVNNATNDNNAVDSTRIKTPSQESEDTEQGGVSLIGGAYRDYKIAVVLKLQLGSSQYATVALRELLKAGGLKTYKADFSGGR